MGRARLGIGTAVAAGALALGGLAFAPAAAAVTPTVATAEYDCGIFGGGTAQLTAAQTGSGIVVSVETAVTTPLQINPGDATTSLTLALNGSGTAVFTGSSNPLMPSGTPYKSGPLTSATSFATGDSLDSYFGGTALTLSIFGTTVSCDAVTAQDPGAFVAD
ncbi:hypothetical protein [Streptomyces sp. NBC_01465]|uniref:hypothetical protein n=1 Tax=Streptomyces sp. NBC_01465 TaxID=2903878 RepID=UPI002E32E3D0|nr:hypothetical protein [Streptomyces sp. NBC_01465]